MAELLGSLSLATDLADGFSLEKSLRTALLSTRLARLCSDDEAAIRLVYWSSLLRFTGCTAFAHEEARHYAAGDDIGLRGTLAYVDFGRPSTFIGRALRDIGAKAPLLERGRAIGRLLLQPDAPGRHARAQCEAGKSFAQAIGMPDVAHILSFREERWDGKGPRRAAAEQDLPWAERVADVADIAELFAWSFGIDEAREELARRRGGALDPQLVDAFLRHAPQLFDGVLGPGVWEPFLDAEPLPYLRAPSTGEGPSITTVLAAFGRIADLTSVHTLGHSLAVAEAARAAAGALGLREEECTLAHHGGLAHDLGRVGVPVGIWDKPGPLTPLERERVRSHSHHTETVLRLCPALTELAEVAGQTHERGAGDGYHRRIPIDATSIVARVVAAADAFVAMGAARPHRPALPRLARERELLAMARSGQLDARVVQAVLEAHGARKDKTRNPLGLSDRELEVARLVAIGRTNPEIGRLLGISPRTAQRHVMHVYDKLGVESRAGLALTMMQHGLVGERAD